MLSSPVADSIVGVPELYGVIVATSGKHNATSVHLYSSPEMLIVLTQHILL